MTALFSGISLTGLALALLLPWLTGTLAVRLVLGTQAPPAACLGYGFFLGQLLVIVSLLLVDALFGRLGWGLALAPLLLLGSGLAAGVVRSGWRLPRSPHRSAPGPMALVAIIVLMALILLRFGLMLPELAMRPVFAWDAWMNWVPRAVVWFHHAELTPFVLPPDWLAAPPGTEVYTLGNWRASGYPPGLPLMLLWMMLGAGTADHPLLFLPGLIAPAAFALVLGSHLRSQGLGPVLVLVMAYFFLSQPLANTHSMLGGYADFWLGLYFSLGLLAADRWRRGEPAGLALLGLLMAAGCVWMKTPGLGFGALVVLALVAVALRVPGRWLSAAVVVGLAGIVALLLGGLLGEPMLPAAERPALPLPGFLPELKLQPQPLLPLLLDSLWLSSNWHLLWVLVGVCGLMALRLRGPATLDSIAVLGLVAALGVLVFVFGYTHYFRQAENLVTLNRTLLYLVPLAVYVSGVWLAQLQEAPGDDD